MGSVVNRNSSLNYFLQVSRGKVAGSTSDSIRAHNPDVDIAIIETIWDQGGVYTYLTADTELFISSTSVLDVNVGVLIEGMTDDYNLKTEVVTFTSGQSQQSVTSFFRIFKMTIISGVVPVGDLYLAEAGALTNGIPNTATEIKAKMIQGINITRMGLFTIPAFHSLYFVHFSTATRKNKDSVILPLARPQGFPGFIEVTQFPTYQSDTESSIVIPIRVNEKTDVELRASSETNNSEVTATAEYLLIDERI